MYKYWHKTSIRGFTECWWEDATLFMAVVSETT
jgi:hypothetical protein